ncbi:hypothetical protein MPSEU_000046500 [Mayamaea pseudoterrestris]|nr:hypothetical protein MPSEU_000046500 [Mayamaea pseudoterrestris]
MVTVTIPKNMNSQAANDWMSPQPHGWFPQSTPFVMTGIILMHSMYRILYYIYENPSIAAYLSIPSPSSDYCNNSEKCGRPDLFAFQCVSAATFWTIGILSLRTWYARNGARSSMQVSTPEHRIYSGLPVTETIASINMSYQLWDFYVSLSIPEHCTIIMMTHHFVAAIVCWSVLTSRTLGCHAVFFLGMSEVSSMWLVLLDMSKYFSPSQHSLAHVVVEHVAGPLFVVTFIYYRVILWWRVSYQFWNDVQSVKTTGQSERLRPGRTWVLHLLLSLMIPMGILQLYWLTIIAQEVQGVLSKEDMA